MALSHVSLSTIYAFTSTLYEGDHEASNTSGNPRGAMQYSHGDESITSTSKQTNENAIPMMRKATAVYEYHLKSVKKIERKSERYEDQQSLSHLQYLRHGREKLETSMSIISVGKVTGQKRERGTRTCTLINKEEVTCLSFERPGVTSVERSRTTKYQQYFELGPSINKITFPNHSQSYQSNRTVTSMQLNSRRHTSMHGPEKICTGMSERKMSRAPEMYEFKAAVATDEV
ncbi:hypothetical protein BJ508DRAFT_312830 [Ascobolus immersus RN42]|uniref:Uncharacterized protein n=1 Tax=Ascobolus immersus RN42 TaxID=1160509 RepID=A0A3N4HKT3_ASCIM|nr:hypothetical protein BJ508DRAFT_312830 [Ascobolus immersus RN42]